MVVVCLVNGELYCVDDVCTHDGGPLGDGLLDGHELICPRHGARFDVTNGRAKSMPATEDTAVHDIKVVDDEVLVRINPQLEDAPNVAANAAPTLSEDSIREELKKVIDPELFVNIVDLGLVYVVDLIPADNEKTNVQIQMTTTSPMCPAGPQMIANAKSVLGQLSGIGSVEIKIVMDPPWTPDRMTDDARDHLGIF